MAKNTVNKTISMRPEIYDKIRGYADNYGISASSMIQVMCIEFMKQQEAINAVSEVVKEVQELKDMIAENAESVKKK